MKNNSNYPPKESHYILRTLALIVIFLLLTGCSFFDSENSSTSKESTEIQNVIEETFSGPDMELIELFDSSENLTIIGEENEEVAELENVPTKLDVYLEEKYKDYFSESVYDDFVVRYGISYHVKAYSNGYHVEVDEIDIKPNENSEGLYNFTADVSYGREQDMDTVEVSGRADYYEKEKIGNFEIVNDNGLLNKLNEN
ncbi:hypothetical protein [Saliterribacillus persicus]|uniref:Lipoprotein n=1 Tax=Saliterribacillus persicus TaxID=930114 RepID=A0A368XYX5_9BACI|nr:hypothetical protein [Saliterribacillus persicus]RCW73065.1 hypothetical protein DFR57_10460 [Saliterribacillus persicus]